MQVVMIAAQSIDGFITHHDKPGSGFTSPEDKAYFLRCLRDFDSQIMGAKTFRAWQGGAAGSTRPGRPQWVITREPNKFVHLTEPGRLEFSSLSPRDLLEVLEKRGLQRCALLGGAQVHRLFLAANCVHEIWLTIEPVLFGAGTPLVAGTISAQCRLISTESLSADTLLVKYRVESSSPADAGLT